MAQTKPKHKSKSEFLRKIRYVRTSSEDGTLFFSDIGGQIAVTVSGVKLSGYKTKQAAHKALKKNRDIVYKKKGKPREERVKDLRKQIDQSGLPEK